ncbi:hypothetical protein [Chitinophaga sp. Ak27]|uniref:hypothetical protein n=1 Tax=Chitinophaga sp. Ak27 TaxID=2726116 RepID=UPI00145E1D01|nr:hypothetical protein [Chitinophaga sp. Ak27]NLU91355.1 hypothetical protein [Chitinophaga sp. Ak27]
MKYKQPKLPVFDKIFIFISLSVLLLHPNVFSQTSNPNLPVIPPSPTAFNLGKYGFIKPGFFTGAVSLEIPITVYKTPNIEVPVSLRYNSSGIKVEELSSRTGLVWNLNAGGAIIRMIKDEPDGYYSSRVMPEEVMKEISGDKMDPTFRAYLLNGAKEHFDTEYDVFSFNFLNFSGKFIITEKGEYIQEKQSSLRIENIGGNIDNGFMITDDLGIKYIFSEKETTQSSSGPDNRSPILPTGWYLSSVIHPKGDTVYFKYTRVITSFSFSGGESYTRITVNSTTQPNLEFNQFITANSGYKEHLVSLNAIDGKRLSSIESNYGHRIDFYNRIDNPGQGGDSLLTNIVVKGSSGKILDDIKLSYFISGNSRVFLDTVRFAAPNNRYILNYNSPEGFPTRTSKSQDHWGYYNGKNNSTLLPPFAGLPGAYTSADRDPDSQYTQTGLLKEVVFPTGGRTSFVYEPNTFASTKFLQNSSSVSVRSETGSIDNGVEVSSVTMNAGIDQLINVFATLSNASLSECPASQDPDVLRRKGGKLKIYDLTTGKSIPIGPSNDSVEVITNGLGDRSYTAYLFGGHQYKIILTTFSCSRLNVTSAFVSQSEPVPYNEITGGVRLKETKTVSQFGAVTSSTYKYTEKIDSVKSSGIVPFDAQADYSSIRDKAFYSKVYNSQGVLVDAIVYSYNETKIASSSLNPIFDIAGNQVAYATVIENQVNDSMDNGVILHHFRYERNPIGQLIYGDGSYKPNTYSNYFYPNGLEDYTAYYQREVNGYSIIKEEFFDYGLVGTNSIQTIPMVKVQNSFTPPCQNDIVVQPDETCGIVRYADPVSVTTENAIKQYRFSTCKANHRHIWIKDANGIKHCLAAQSINEDGYIPHFCFNKTPGTVLELKKTDALDAVIYNFYSYPYSLISKKEINYTDKGSIVNTINYTYDNENHIKSTAFVNSRGERVKDTCKYPVDLKGNIVYDSMIARNMTGYLIEQSTLNGTTELKKLTTRYAFWGDKGDVLPIDVQRSISSLQPFTEVTFKQYNKNGQVTEALLLNGQTEAYVWGYKNLYPVAKVIGADYNTVIKLINTVLLDNAASYTDQQIRDELNKLRTNLPDAMVKTYTYSPGIGISSETDPSGRVTYYEYDNFARLKSIKDQNGKIIKQYDYQYQQSIAQ